MRVSRSSLLSFLLIAQVSLPAIAQDAWDYISNAASAQRAPDCYVLVSSPPALKFNWYGEDPLAEADLREFRRVTLEGESAETIKQVLGGIGWALFSPKGERVDEGTGVPTTARIRQSMEKAGWKPMREALQEHLRHHPEDGQAQAELTFHLARQGREGKYAGTLSHTWIERLRGDLVPSLRALAEMPDWGQGLAEAQPQPFGPTIAALHVAELDKDPEIGDSVKKLFAVVPPLLICDPENRILWTIRDFTRREGDGTEDGPVFLASLEGVPDRPWPPLFLADQIRRWYQKDPVLLAQVSSTLVERNLEPNLINHLGLSQVAQTLETWGELHLEALLRQGQFNESLAYVGWMRIQAGKAWPEVSSSLSKALRLTASGEGSDPKSSEVREYPLSVAQRESLQTSLFGSPVPNPPLPTIEPLRLVLLDAEWESTKELWENLQHSPAFALWDSTELNWMPLRANEIEHLTEHYNWPHETRWVLLQGDQMLASQAGFPTAQTLESNLYAQGTPRLEALRKWIKMHPNRMDARRERVELIRSRLPNPTLELIFLEDLEALEAAPGTLGFRPNTERWGPVAHRIINRLSNRISHWPFHAATWKAYVDWTDLFSNLPPPSTVLAGLETFPRQLGIRLPGPLPSALSLTIVKALEDKNRFIEVEAWMQILWDRGLKSWLLSWTSLPPLPKKAAGGWLDQMAPDVQTLLAMWGNALRKSGQIKVLGSLRWELESVKPGLGTLLGNDK